MKLFARKQKLSPAPAAFAPDEISGEIIAVISAAVAAMAPEGVRYAVHSVKPVSKRERPIWATAGLLESTRPFC